MIRRDCTLQMIRSSQGLLTPHEKRKLLTTHVPISNFENLTQSTTGMHISVHSTNKPLFPQNYTAWTTPTQLIKKHHSLLYRLLPTATSTLLRITRGRAQHKMDVGHDSNGTTRGRYKITRHRNAIHSDRHQYVVTTSFHCPTDF